MYVYAAIKGCGHTGMLVSHEESVQSIAKLAGEILFVQNEQ
jgi:hypothetical protein